MHKILYKINVNNEDKGINNKNFRTEKRNYISVEVEGKAFQY